MSWEKVLTAWSGGYVVLTVQAGATLPVQFTGRLSYPVADAEGLCALDTGYACIYCRETDVMLLARPHDQARLACEAMAAASAHNKRGM